jgi:bifunctional DNA-binding transcriptional regulator/antitoxin component of YhaV-PrlF toxin-antitoxin module
MPYYRGTLFVEAAMATKVTDEGQVTIPKWVQDQVGGPGSEVTFRCAADGSIVIEKAEAAPPLDPDRFAKLRGIAGPGPSTDEIMAMTRGD